mmetsp:Transcript_5286/g.10771  ORF Transcript_5286/g.10771 Transcript_5286/m.10771 type:complete len:232 (-) Transcript_5286:267-962(-)
MYLRKARRMRHSTNPSREMAPLLGCGATSSRSFTSLLLLVCDTSSSLGAGCDSDLRRLGLMFCAAFAALSASASAFSAGAASASAPAEGSSSAMGASFASAGSATIACPPSFAFSLATWAAVVTSAGAPPASSSARARAKAIFAADSSSPLRSLRPPPRLDLLGLLAAAGALGATSSSKLASSGSSTSASASSVVPSPADLSSVVTGSGDGAVSFVADKSYSKGIFTFTIS